MDCKFPNFCLQNIYSRNYTWRKKNKSSKHYLVSVTLHYNTACHLYIMDSFYIFIISGEYILAYWFFVALSRSCLKVKVNVHGYGMKSIPFCNHYALYTTIIVFTHAGIVASVVGRSVASVSLSVCLSAL